jgi:hypothetical protein
MLKNVYNINEGAVAGAAVSVAQEPRVLIVIPAYNEQDCIQRTVRSVVDAGYDYVVINDGSTDRTREICLDCGFNFVDLPQNLGIGGGVQTGHKYALAHGYDIDIQFDGDGQHDVAYIPVLVNAISAGADLVIGSRFVEKTDGFQSTFMRRVGINWLSRAIRIVTRTKIADPTSGFRACNAKAIKLFARSYPVDYPEPESIVAALKKGLDVKEVPVIMHERAGGASSIGGWSSIYYMVKVTLSILIAGFTSRKGV